MAMKKQSVKEVEARRNDLQNQFLKHQNQILFAIRRVLPDINEAMDVLQETYLTIIRKSEAWQPGSNFMAWAVAVARFEILNFIRLKRKNAGSVSIESLILDESDQKVIDDCMNLDEDLQLLGSCIEELSPVSRHIIELRYQKGYSTEQIANEIGWTANAVSVSLSRSRIKLRECIMKLRAKDA